MRKQIALISIYGILNYLLIALAISEKELSMPDNMNAILIKCPKSSSNQSCETQLIINIHMNPSFDVDNADKFWVVDKVYEPSKGTISKIISPYLIVVSRGEPVVMYPLQFLKAINHDEIRKKPLEEVTDNKDTDGSASCHLEQNFVEQEMGNKSRLKRNNRLGYSRGKSIVSHFLVNEKHDKPRQVWNSEKKVNNQPPKDISSLGLIQVMDPMFKKSHLETPIQFSHLNKDIGNEYDRQGKIIKSHQNYNQEMKFDDRLGNNQIESEQCEDLNNNALDDNEIRFFNKDIKNQNDQHSEEEYKTHKNSDFESVPDFLLYDQMSEAEKKKHVQEKMEHESKSPGNDFSYGKNYEDFHLKSSTNRLSETSDFLHKNEYEDFNNNYFPQKKENEKNNLKTHAKGQSNEYDFPLERNNENKLFKSPNNDPINVNDFSEASKNFNIKPLVNDFSHERDNEQNKFNVPDSYEYSQKSKKDNFIFGGPVNYKSSVKDFPRGGENKKYSFSDVNGFSNELHKTNLNFKPEKTNSLDNSISNVNDFESDKEKLNYNKPLYPNNEFPLERKSEYSNVPVSNFNDFSWAQTNAGTDSLFSIVNHHMKQKLPTNFDFVSQNDLNSKYFSADVNGYSRGIDTNYLNFKAENPYDLGNSLSNGYDFANQKYSDDLYHTQTIKPFSTFPKTNYYRPRSVKRIKRSKSELKNIAEHDTSRFHQKYKNDINALKMLNLKSIEDNGEIPCDTCGGKNKKKDEKPRTIYSSVSEESENPGSKIEDADLKINDPVPCDTCGGKNKKPGEKPLPGGFPSEIKSSKPENKEPRRQDYMIPCEKCRVTNKCTEGNLESQSCGCLTNPSVCNCESSKSSRALNKSATDDINYTVFNMKDPLPFLTTKLRVFRRRHNTWWRVVPIITLDSMSGIYANKDLSAVFTSHVDMIRLEKSLSFSNQKLVIPRSNDKKRHLNTLKELQNNIANSFLIDTSSKNISIREIKNSINLNMEKDGKKSVFTTRSIDGLGYFPVSMNALENCPHKDKHLCLNIREEKVPEFSIKLKIPFRENALVIRNKHMVKISRIVTDATTKDALQISIDVINKGFEAQEFTIYVCNCELSKSPSIKTSVRKLLQPDIGQTVTFLLPLITASRKNNKFSCDVLVKANQFKEFDEMDLPKHNDQKVGIVAKRSMDIKCNSRCFCVWRCRCHCIGKLETFINYNACERMDPKSEKEAGLIYNCPPGNEKNDVCIKDISNERIEDTTCNLGCQILAIALLIFTLLFLLGVLKAILGICIYSIGRCGFDTIQPGRTYECTSGIRVFLINCFFFIIFAFACWCTLFRPKAKDIIEASSDWCVTSNSDDEIECNCEDSSSTCRLHGGQDKNIHNDLVLAFAPLHENGLFKDEKSDDEESHLFILEVLEESKNSLNKMMSQASDPTQNVEQSKESNVDIIAAEEYIDSLRNSPVAYRTMSSPVGGVIDIPDNYQYCVKGFFLPTVNSTYEFMSYHPLTQFLGISKENEVKRLPQPQYIYSDEFSKIYADKTEVLKAGDLSVVPPLNVPCINIDHWNQLENSFVKLSTQQEQLKANKNEESGP